MTAEEVRTLLDPYDPLPLECDGFTRVATYVLTRAGVPHDVYSGQVFVSGEHMPLHYWVILGDGTVVDYRLRMWFGEAPHGVFEHNEDGPVIYVGKKIEMTTSQVIFDILTSRG